MTDDDILTMAERHHVRDPSNVYPRDEEVVAFSRELASRLMGEIGERPLAAGGLDWREKPRSGPQESRGATREEKESP